MSSFDSRNIHNATVFYISFKNKNGLSNEKKNRTSRCASTRPCSKLELLSLRNTCVHSSKKPLSPAHRSACKFYSLITQIVDPSFPSFL